MLPYDLSDTVSRSVAKTHKVLFVDEDVPGGMTAYMLNDLLKRKNAFYRLDAAPRTLSAKPHLPAYGSDGDYFSKPSVDDIVEKV